MSKTVPWDAIPEAESITVTDAGVHVRDLFVARKDVADYLYVIPRDERLPARR